MVFCSPTLNDTPVAKCEVQPLSASLLNWESSAINLSPILQHSEWLRGLANTGVVNRKDGSPISYCIAIPLLSSQSGEIAHILKQASHYGNYERQSGGREASLFHLEEVYLQDWCSQSITEDIKRFPYMCFHLLWCVLEYSHLKLTWECVSTFSFEMAVVVFFQVLKGKQNGGCGGPSKSRWIESSWIQRLSELMSKTQPVARSFILH